MFPESCALELSSAKELWASMMSMTASAFVRSILPFKKALLVNSPGSASLQPFFKRKDKRFVGGSFSKVFKAYIKKMQKERAEKRKCSDPIFVRKRNEGQLLKINDEIDIISQILEEKKMKLKNKK